ncbi:MAG: ATP-binding protein [Bradyrhizobium sp.]|nr:ATP-binding protein [Bradyrhizobium sp.]
MLTPSQRQSVLSSLTEAQADELLHDWEFLGRPDQLPPPGDWRTWLFLAGRGAGKTRAGAEWVRSKIRAGYSPIALIAPTAGDARDVMVEGNGGILSVSWSKDRDARGNLMGRPLYEPSKRRLTWSNGSTATLFSGEEPERLRGPQHAALWADEVAAWQDPSEAWDMAMFGLRLGDDPQAMVTTTPKPIRIIRELIKSPTCVITRATTYDNRANLAGAFLSQIVAKYEGTRLGRQELQGELIEELEGALWNRAMIEQARLNPNTKEPLTAVPPMKRIVVAIDPAVTAKEESNLTGIVCAGLGQDGRGYVLADSSGKYSPNEWARRALAQFDSLKADRIIAEGNQGGDLVRNTISTQRPNAPITIVHARQGKSARAEPIAALYEQGRIGHVGSFPDLEDQMCSWEPLGSAPSPDRIDAMVWAFTALMVDTHPATIVSFYGR